MTLLVSLYDGTLVPSTIMSVRENRPTSVFIKPSVCICEPQILLFVFIRGYGRTSAAGGSVVSHSTCFSSMGAAQILPPNPKTLNVIIGTALTLISCKRS